jgi:hypothetical protein
MRQLLTAALLVALTAAGAAQSSDIHGTWTAEIHGGKVFLQTRTAPPPDWNRSGDGRSDWSMGHSLPIEEVSGLANDEQLTASSLRFELRREAGTLAFEGAFRDGRGAGLFTFAPRAEFIAEMKRLGYNDDIPLWRRYQMAVQDVGPRYINALKAEGFDKLTLDEITRARNHGVTLDYIKGMKAEGYKAVSIEDLVRTKDHGVTPQYVKEMRKAGFTSQPIEDLVRAKDHGVNAAFVTELASHGYKGLPLSDVVRARDHGVSADYLADMKAITKDATLPQIIRMRDHGVTPGFVSHARARGFTTSDPDELVRLKDRGLREER